MQHLLLLALVIVTIFYVTVLIKNRPRPDEFFSAALSHEVWSRHVMKILVVIIVALLAVFYFGFLAPEYNFGLIEPVVFAILCSGLLLVGFFSSIDNKSSAHFVSGMIIVVLFLIFVAAIILKVWQELSVISQILLGINLAIIAILTIVGFIGAFATKTNIVRRHLLLFQTFYIIAIALLMIILTYS